MMRKRILGWVGAVGTAENQSFTVKWPPPGKRLPRRGDFSAGPGTGALYGG